MYLNGVKFCICRLALDWPHNWVKKEGDAVEKLLLMLKVRYQIYRDDVFLFSPFKDCAR